MPLFPAEVARLEENRMARSVADISDEVLWVAGGVCCYSPTTDWLRRAYGIGVREPVTAEEIARIVDFYEQRGVPAQVELCPYAHPSYVAGLQRQGFRVFDTEQVFSRELSPGEDLRKRPWPEGLEVVVVDPADDAAVRVFADVSTSGFRDKPLDDDGLDMARRIARHPRCHSLMAVLDGKPVGGGTVEVMGETSALFGASVVEAYRRRGIQGALLVARMEKARELGARIATIGSAAGGPTERNAIRVGFGVAYTKALLTRPIEGA